MKYADLLIQYKNHTNTYPFHTESYQFPEEGLFRDLAFAYEEQRPQGADLECVRLTTTEDIAGLARVAAERYPLIVVPNPNREGLPQFRFATPSDPELDVSALWADFAGWETFKHEDPAVELANYQRYAELANKGRALFGVPVEDIDVVAFCLTNEQEEPFEIW